jgi:predicted O-methyltransferase YrrM
VIFELLWRATHRGREPRKWLKRLTELRHRVVPRPFDRLLLEKRGLVGAEIGVLAGEHAAAMLRVLDIRTLYLVDPYAAYSEHDARDMAAIRLKMRRRLARFPQCHWIQWSSVYAVNHVPDELDFAYIDADHSYKSVQQDIAAWWPKVRSGGILGGHDFTIGHEPLIHAVTEFSVRNALTLYTCSPDWWIVKP